MLGRILVVDDEVNMLKLLRKVLTKEGYEVHTCLTPPEAIRAVRDGGFDLIITDLVMPIMSGLDLMREVKSAQPEMPCIVITAHGSIGSAVEAMKAGAFDYITKPFRKEEIILAIQKAARYCELHQEIRRLREELKAREGMKEIVFKSKAMESVFKLVRQVADSQATVLIQGESGTGKELVARAIHEISSRRVHPFVAVDCGVLPESLLQTELFGHVKGAFTGAVRDKKGLFVAAEGGTIFLDEIGNISPTVQLSLLRVLQEREIRPLGSIATIRVDVRVIAATNMDLERLVRAGKFREDLYYRLAVVPVRLPPLRDRREDIVPLAYHFLARFARQYKKDVAEMTPGCLRILMESPWPGNVRELENVMERAVLLSKGPLMDETAVSFPDRGSAVRETETTYSTAVLKPLRVLSREQAKDREREAVLVALETAAGNKSRAAKLLGISRSSLYNKLRDFALDK